MDLRTYRARSLHAALQSVRADLGDDAAVLHTREIAGGMLSRWFFGKQIEVTASAEVKVPSRFENISEDIGEKQSESPPLAEVHHFRQRFRENLNANHKGSASLLEELDQTSAANLKWQIRWQKRLQSGRISASYAQQLISQLPARIVTLAEHGSSDADRQILAHLQQSIAANFVTTGPIKPQSGHCHIVALVGPTGVGKTTTIAKLAANFRLQEKLRVGLITVDTYRIAAVEQLRTYADIMDLPMEVVSTPAEMKAAITKLADMDLILMDTAGRSPRDEVRLAALQEILAEAQPDEVHLVLSSVASNDALQGTIDRFLPVGVTSAILSKLDEADHLGGITSLLYATALPVSYVTDGQNVPDDIRPADGTVLAQLVFER